jgi:Arc/MetJ-type ribon-helix-helix transcriptional regulator
MKVKTSITLSSEVLAAIDRHSGEFRSRSEFLEASAREFLARLARTATERRDLAIINRRAEALNAEAEDVLSYQVPL